MTDPEALIRRIYKGEQELMELLLHHSRQVADKALLALDRHPELCADRRFVYEAAMLHDIGIIRCHAPGIHCHGDAPYVEHGPLGGAMLREEGLPHHARVAERHTGTGLEGLEPQTIEEQVICWADKFFSKSKPQNEKTLEAALRSVGKFGEHCEARLMHWQNLFG